jgi:hypothetical protein
MRWPWSRRRHTPRAQRRKSRTESVIDWILDIVDEILD